jgi:hypothetical protein
MPPSQPNLLYILFDENCRLRVEYSYLQDLLASCERELEEVKRHIYFMNAAIKSRGAESAVIYENFPPRNIFPQAKFSEKTENFSQRLGRTRVNSAHL